jgi:hypothetical protein
MFAHDLRDLLKRRPFRPFRITLTDGRSYEVRHPELAFLGRSTVILGYPAADTDDDEGPPLYERFKIVDLLHIMEAEPIDGVEAK